MLQSKDLVLKSPFQNDCEVLRKIWPCDEYYLMVRDDPMRSVFLDDHSFDESFSRSLKKENYWLVFKEAEVIGVAFLHSIDTADKSARLAVGIYSQENWRRG